jgi:hypothetical protein
MHLQLCRIWSAAQGVLEGAPKLQGRPHQRWPRQQVLHCVPFCNTCTITTRAHILNSTALTLHGTMIQKKNNLHFVRGQRCKAGYVIPAFLMRRLGGKGTDKSEFAALASPSVAHDLCPIPRQRAGITPGNISTLTWELFPRNMSGS